MLFQQIVINALIRASELGLLAIGLTVTYDILKFANFAHVEFACIGAFLAYTMNVTLGMNIILAGLVAILVVGVLSIFIDRLVFIRLRGASSIALMVTSLGLGIALRNGVRAIWGARIKGYAIGLQNPVELIGVRITPVQIFIILTSVISMVIIHLILKRTKLGKAMRATSANPALAQACGIHTERIVRWVWFMGASLAALGGIMIGLDTHLTPRMGFSVMIPVFAISILGGLGNPYGAMVGALILGLTENIGLYTDLGKILTLNGLIGNLTGLYIPTGYKLAISFIIMIVVLLWRPSGIMGKRER
ncbi:MAG: branched-chain amino acid ABC transporter permease [Proteobacteria bacterium]|jgi:branched-subunit amino acid ABC-type transport system permease component|nr:branched-chain amino acid ABC transporter permease [Pseudomonadota bacterium]